MLHVNVSFPFPGSIALLGGLSFTVQRLNRDGTATISREGPSASFRRDVALDDLVDPETAAQNAAAQFDDADEAPRRIGLYLARILRDRNDIGLWDARKLVEEGAAQGACPGLRDVPQLARILRTMGWAKQGMTGTGYERQPLYARVAG